MISRDTVVAEARGWIGTPYCHQGSAKGGGADCLGLVRGVWRAVRGDEPWVVPAYSPDWAEAGQPERLLEALGRFLVPVAGPVRPGQILAFRLRDRAVVKHLGLAVPGLGFVHAYWGHGVVESPLSAPWARRIAARFDFPDME